MGQRDCPFVPLCKRARDVRSRRGPFVRGSAASQRQRHQRQLATGSAAAFASGQPTRWHHCQLAGARRLAGAPLASACYFAASPTSPAAERLLRR